MTKFERFFVWLGGALFAGSIALVAWWYFVFLNQIQPSAGWWPLAYDAALFSIFAVHHSVFARVAVKDALARVFPERLLRSLYVWTASILLMLLCLMWLPLGGELYHDTGWLLAVHIAVQLVGVVFIVRSVRAIDALELAGIRAATPPASASSTDTRRQPDGLQIGGPYHVVRHPLYLGWMLVVFGAAHMTRDRMAFAAISSFYLVVAIPWEERSLSRTFGAEYEGYKRKVKWRVIPYVY